MVTNYLSRIADFASLIVKSYGSVWDLAVCLLRVADEPRDALRANEAKRARRQASSQMKIIRLQKRLRDEILFAFVQLLTLNPNFSSIFS
jgi:hypothetical protein